MGDMVVLKTRIWIWNNAMLYYAEQANRQTEEQKRRQKENQQNINLCIE